jgi:hypothetical protein
VNDSLLEKVMVAAVGPLVAAIVGSLVIGLFVRWIAIRAENNRNQYQLRHELITQITEAASALHFPLEEYFRAKLYGSEEDAEVQRKAFEEQYTKTRVIGEILESRLDIYFPSGQPKKYWHQTKDFLIVRRLHALDRTNEISRKAGRRHTGMTEDQLMNIDLAVSGYRMSLRNCIRAVLKERLVLPWVGQPEAEDQGKATTSARVTR